jgi:hypothetical protein
VEREDKSFIEPARSFVANERGHFIAEEEIVFPYAAKSFAAGRLHITDENAASAGPIPEHILNLVQDLVS